MMPYFKSLRIKFNAAKRTICTDSAKNFVTLQREMEQLLDLDHDELLLREINDLRADFNFWVEDQAETDSLFRAELNATGLPNNGFERGQIGALMRASENRILARPNVAEFVENLDTLDGRLQSASASSSYSYSSS